MKLIKNGLNKIKAYFQLSNPSLAIIERAVLLGIESNIITVRKAKYTIRKLIYAQWNDEKYSEKD